VTEKLDLISTCPQSKDVDAREYARRVADVSRWSEEAGCSGILVYTDNGISDPWLVSQLVIQSTDQLRPLVAVQPVYMHPYAVAKMVTSLALLHQRAVDLNLLAGGFRNDLLALGDDTPHDERYERTVAYGRIVLDLLRGEEPVTRDGRYYRVDGLRLTPPLEPALASRVMISGSSPAGLAAAGSLGALPVRYPGPPDEEEPPPEGKFGVRVGLIARDSAEEAWAVAHDRFPESRTGQITHKLAMKVSDSHWHKRLSGDDPGGQAPEDGEPNPYWLGPFKNYNTFCPYLVGTYDRIGAELARYVDRGCTTVILDIPPDRQELEHVEAAARAAVGRES
jgi:alkanesulfonate monooxygenase